MQLSVILASWLLSSFGPVFPPAPLLLHNLFLTGLSHIPFLLSLSFYVLHFALACTPSVSSACSSGAKIALQRQLRKEVSCTGSYLCNLGRNREKIQYLHVFPAGSSAGEGRLGELALLQADQPW